MEEPGGLKESDMTEATEHTHTLTAYKLNNHGDKSSLAIILSSLELACCSMSGSNPSFLMCITGVSGDKKGGLVLQAH